MVWFVLRPCNGEYAAARLARRVRRVSSKYDINKLMRKLWCADGCQNAYAAFSTCIRNEECLCADLVHFRAMS
jgi:hypothetical protein